jgi:hypothetical protein
VSRQFECAHSSTAFHGAGSNEICISASRVLCTNCQSIESACLVIIDKEADLRLIHGDFINNSNAPGAKELFTFINSLDAELLTISRSTSRDVKH